MIDTFGQAGISDWHERQAATKPTDFLGRPSGEGDAWRRRVLGDVRFHGNGLLDPEHRLPVLGTSSAV